MCLFADEKKSACIDVFIDRVFLALHFCVTVLLLLLLFFPELISFVCVLGVYFRNVFHVNLEEHANYSETVKHTILDGTANWAAKVAITGSQPHFQQPISMMLQAAILNLYL